VRVLVVGCGGNGSAIAAGLPYLHQALLAYGHPEGRGVELGLSTTCLAKAQANQVRYALTTSYQVVLWKQENFAVLRPLQIEFSRNLLEGLRAKLWVCQSPVRWRIVWTIIAT